LRNYDGHPLPREDIALNVLEEMGVPRDKAAEVHARIVASADQVGFLVQVKGKDYVSLEDADVVPAEGPGGASDSGSDEDATGSEARAGEAEAPVAPAIAPPSPVPPSAPRPQPTSSLAVAIADDARRRRVFITHGKNRDLVDPVKHLLEYGELTPVVSVERQSVSKPVPEKVMDDMRSCGAAIIHVDADRKLTDTAGADHVLLNPNVLIEIGAAMAFYGRRFILLVREGVQLPSNLQGLYEVRYSGDTLDAAATIRLLEAIKDIKNYGLPTDDAGSDS
jgi:hypothetical protein